MMAASVVGAALYSYGQKPNAVQQFDAQTPATWMMDSTNLLGGRRYGQKVFQNGLKFECSQYFKAGNPNDWHVVKLTSDDFKTFTWTNKAGVKWTLSVS